MSIPPRRFVRAGLAGGLLLNLIDTPWSVVVMVPRLNAFTSAHQLVPSPLVGPWFLAAHFALMLAMAWLYETLAPRLGAGTRQALAIGGLLLVLNRAFGAANVLMGLMPLSLFLGFSVSFCVGVLAASIVAGRIVDGRAGQARPIAA